MRININKLSEAEYLTNSEGCFGFFEDREGFKKLVAYGPVTNELKFTWVHKDYVE